MSIFSAIPSIMDSLFGVKRLPPPSQQEHWLVTLSKMQEYARNNPQYQMGKIDVIINIKNNLK